MVAEVHAIAEAASASGKGAAAALVISCSGRKVLLGEQIKHETSALTEAFAPDLPLAGFTSFGEIAPLRRADGYTRNLFHNMTYVLLVIERGTREHALSESMIGEPPAGFVGGRRQARVALRDRGLLAADCESAYALLPDFRTRVEGVVLTFGSPAAARVGPLLWHISLSREALLQGGEFLTVALEAIGLASVADDQARHAKHAEERLLRSDHEVRRRDYLRVTEALQNQVGLVTASERKLSAILESVDARIYLLDRRGATFSPTARRVPCGNLKWKTSPVLAMR
nr:FIST C-terminal domain-containing protein [Propionivibrio sp.]